jgi:hypothetical protein
MSGHGRIAVGLLLGASLPLLRQAYTRDAYAPLLRRGIRWACAGRIHRPQIDSAAFWEQEFKNSLFNSFILIQTLKQTRSVCLRAF